MCDLFGNDKRVGKGETQKVGSLVHPLTGYKNAIDHFNSKLAYHRGCCAKSEVFKRTFGNPGVDIRGQLNQERIKMFSFIFI